MRLFPIPSLRTVGRGRCKQCGNVLSEHAIYWCSDACEDYWVDDSL
jgi:hypothetical protein